MTYARVGDDRRIVAERGGAVRRRTVVPTDVPRGRRFDIVGQRFGKWTVLSCEGKNAQRVYSYLCRCDCGVERVVDGSRLRQGISVACGCRKKEKYSVVRTHKRTYQVWKSMRQRCNNPNSKNWDKYGGRGIRVCERWNNFEFFLADMGSRPDGTSIDRIDNDGNYEPGNCRWASAQTQSANRRCNRHLEYNGKVQTLVEWARELNIAVKKLRGAIREFGDIENGLANIDQINSEGVRCAT